MNDWKAWPRALAYLLATTVLALSACGGGAGLGAGDDASAGTSSADAEASINLSERVQIAAVKAAATSTIDSVEFGNVTSESSHGLTTGFAPVAATVAPIPSEAADSAASDVATGGLGLAARRLLPRTPNGDYYGGELKLKMGVDPTAQNYFTLKIWGGDTATDNTWLVLEVDGKEVGGRHETDDESMLLNAGGFTPSGYAPGRFVYRTVRLPWALTRGKTTVNVRVRSLGRMAYYATGYDSYQKRMTSPSVGLYRAYIHTSSFLDVSGETQGSAPTTVRASVSTAAEEAAWVTAWKTRVNNELTAKLAASASALTADDIDYLSQGYSTAWTSVYQNPAVITKIVAAFDAKVTAYAAEPTTYLASKFPDFGGNAGWGGYFGPVGRTIVRLGTPLLSTLDTSVAYGGSIGTTTRRAAWATALRASVDFGRVNRKTIANQAMDAARRTYWANAGLRLVDATQALNEVEARRYLYEAYGIAPFLGADQPGGGPVPVRGTAPYGPNWYMVTSRGTTKEDCLVGGDYGEQGGGALRLGLDIGDAQLVAQGQKMLRARTLLRTPAADANGKMASYIVEPIGCRNDQSINRHVAYLDRGLQAVQLAALGASVLGSDLMAYVQQQYNDGQLLANLPVSSAWLNGFAGASEVVSVPEAYAAFRGYGATGRELPMAAGQPNVAWADEENMVVAAKYGENRFWANLNWRGPAGINRLARVYELTPQTTRLAEVNIDDVAFTPTGATVVRDGNVDNTPPYGYPPPDGPVNANQGLVLPLAVRPDLSAVPATNRDSGRAHGYTLRYGQWLVVINGHPTNRYKAMVPSDFNGGVDLISGSKFGTSVTLNAKTAAVFYMNTATPAVKMPINPLMPRAVGGNGVVALSWDAVPGAVAYQVFRAVAGTASFTNLGQVTSNSHVDRAVTNGSGYVYRVRSVSSTGAVSGMSPDTTATPMTGSLPAPWAQGDVGSFYAGALPGTATLSNGTYALTSQQQGLFGTADSFQFAFVPMLGDGTVTVRVASQAKSATQAPAGLTIRESLSPASRHVSIVSAANYGLHFRFRTATAAATGNSVRTATATAPYWLRLVRSGSVISAFVSPDGVTWTAHGSQELPGLGNVAFVGLVVGSGLNAVATNGAATFDNVSVPTLP